MTEWKKDAHDERCNSQDLATNGFCDCGKVDRDALIDELTEARRERDAARAYGANADAATLKAEAALANARSELARLDHSHRADTAATRANARAATAEEAARVVDCRCVCLKNGPTHILGTHIRSLAPLDPSLLVVERETVEAVKAALGGAHALLGFLLDEGMTTLHDHDDGCAADDGCECSIKPAIDRFNETCAANLAALTRLEGLKP